MASSASRRVIFRSKSGPNVINLRSWYKQLEKGPKNVANGGCAKNGRYRGGEMPKIAEIGYFCVIGPKLAVLRQKGGRLERGQNWVSESQDLRPYSQDFPRSPKTSQDLKSGKM